MSEQKEAASKDGHVHWKTHLISSTRQRHWYDWAELRSEVVRNSSTRELNSSAGESGQRLPSRAVVRNERFQALAIPICRHATEFHPHAGRVVVPMPGWEAGARDFEF